MRRKILIGLSVAVVAAVVLTVVAVAGGTTTLPSLTPAELLAKMSAAGGQTTSISGEVSWTNDLLGGGLLGQLQSQSGSAQSPLTGSGSGRVWVSPEGLRLESQSNGGDLLTVVSTTEKTAWVYDSATNTVKKWVVTGGTSGTMPMPSVSPTTLTPSQIEQVVQKLAPSATVAADGQTTVAGRDAYVLKLTPKATDTAVGPIEVAVDGKTFVPLRLQVFAAGAKDPTLSFGFTSVSYGTIDPSMFTFTPPNGATVTTKQVDASKLQKSAKADGDAKDAEGSSDTDAVSQAAQRARLTQDQAQQLAGFKLATAQDAARPFSWAYVLDKGGVLTADGTPLSQLFGMSGGTAGTAGQDTTGSGQVQNVVQGPVAVLVYGKGLGAVALAETKTTSQLDAQLSKLPQMGNAVTVGGHQAKLLSTPLGGAIAWQDGGRTLVAFGLVTSQDLQAFAASVQ